MGSGVEVGSQLLHDSFGPISASGWDEEAVPVIVLEHREYMHLVPCDNIYTHHSG